MATPALASGHLNGLAEGLEILMFMAIAGGGCVLLSLVLAAISYRSGSKALNVAAWVVTFFALIVAAGIAVYGRGLVSWIALTGTLPFLSITFLFARVAKNSVGQRFVTMYIVRSVAAVMFALLLAKNTLSLVAPGLTYRYSYIVALALIACVMVFLFTRRLLAQAGAKEVASPLSPVKICLWIGMGSYTLQLVYTLLAIRFRGVSYLLSNFHTMAPLLIALLIAAALSVVTGLVVKAVGGSREIV